MLANAAASPQWRGRGAYPVRTAALARLRQIENRALRGGPDMKHHGTRAVPSLRYLRRVPIWTHTYASSFKERLEVGDNTPFIPGAQCCQFRRTWKTL
jgi:hypothetical protein